MSQWKGPMTSVVAEMAAVWATKPEYFVDCFGQNFRCYNCTRVLDMVSPDTTFLLKQGVKLLLTIRQNKGFKTKGNTLTQAFRNMDPVFTFNTLIRYISV